jgi:hypothetical protein
MNISRYPLTNDLWAVVAPLIGDSFFGSRGFADLWRTKGGKPMYWVAEDAQRILAVLPGVEFGIKPFQRLYAMPNGCYARLFYNPQVTVEKERIARMMLDGLAAARYAKLFIYDFYNSILPDLRFDAQRRTTTLVDISDPNWQPPDKNLRQEIRKAVKEGIRLEKFDPDRHFSGFLHLIKLSETRLRRKCGYSAEFFKELAALAVNDERVRWVWCEHNGEAVCSSIFVIEYGQVLFWQMYFNKAFSFLKPNQYIPYATVRSLAPTGVRQLNLGTSPENAPGVTFYKSRWGGAPYYYHNYVMKRGVGRFF